MMKSFRSTGSLHRLPDRVDVFQLALKIFLIGQHAERIGAAAA